MVKGSHLDNKKFAEKLIKWYNTYRRDLPWRETTDPFKIWLSEVILQQTRVAQGLPYYNRFVENFADVRELAAADEQVILRLWQGLGYYSRARNLHNCAKEVAGNLGGNFPKSYKKLLKLPGIGKYTAAAIASFAFGERVPVVDGNVYRVLSRIYGMHDDIAAGPGQEAFRQLAAQLVSETQPDLYNQAIMEFGAIHCTPKNPDCGSCIFNLECEARRQNLQHILPVKSKKVKVKNRYFNYIVLKQQSKMALKKRMHDDIWKGLYDYLLVESPDFIGYKELLHEHTGLDQLAPHVRNVDISADYRHVLTHRRIFARFYTISFADDAPLAGVLEQYQLKFFDEQAVYQLPKPVLVSRYLNDTIF